MSLTSADGLVYNRVTALWRDAAGALWMETGTTESALVRHVPTTHAPSLTISETRSEPRLWSLDVAVAFSGA